MFTKLLVGLSSATLIVVGASLPISAATPAPYSAALTSPGTLGPDRQATWGPDSKTVYFVRANSGDPKIYKQVIGSSSASFVTYGSNPRVSPDGKSLAFIKLEENSGFSGQGPLVVYDMSTKRITKDLDELTKIETGGEFAWSPDGKYLYFQGVENYKGNPEDISGDLRDLYRFDISSNSAAKVTNGLGQIDALKVLSNGQEAVGIGIVQSEQLGVKVDLITGQFEKLHACYVYNTYSVPIPIPRSTDYLCSVSKSIVRKSESGELIGTIDTIQGDAQASVSPNGSWLIYNRNNRATGRSVIWLRSLDGSTLSKVVSPQNGVSINSGAVATNDENVTLNLVIPEWATEVLVSNDGSFSEAQTFGIEDSSIPWTLDSYAGVTSRVVYVRFGSDLTYTDNIIVDKTAPTISSASKGRTSYTTSNKVKYKKASVKTSLTEKGSGLSQVQYNSTASTTGATAVTFTANPSSKKISKSFTIKIRSSSKYGYFRIKDKAGNWSSWKKIRV